MKSRKTKKDFARPLNHLSCQLLIFITGGITLSLEVLSSRIMTPYFGVSLYIWAGILSITLIFLALGYQYGGFLTRRYSSKNKLAKAFWLFPIISAFAMVVSCLIYPVLFVSISEFSLIIGSFIASIILLALPLIGLSAMNPILIALIREDTDTDGDAGAGSIFFISTIGSVAGVIVTAFILIPHLTNFRSMLLSGLALCIASLILMVLSESVSKSERNLFIAGYVFVSILCAAFLIYQQHYFDFLDSVSKRYYKVKIQAEYSSLFGNIKVVDVPQEGSAVKRLYVQDALIQNMTNPNGVSLTKFTYMLEHLSRAFASDAKEILILGLGAGIVPRNMKRLGKNVTVVEINPDAVKAAAGFFHFNPEGITLYKEDARIFVKHHRNSYDLVIIDLFQGDNTPDYLLTKEFFHDLNNCLHPDGAIIMNAFIDPINEKPNLRLFATIGSAFPNILEYHLSPQKGKTSEADFDAFIVASNRQFSPDINPDLKEVPQELINPMHRMLSSGSRITPDIWKGAEPVTDDHNVFTFLFANSRMVFRRHFVKLMSPRILVN